MIKGKHRKAELVEERVFQGKYLGSIRATEPGIAGIEQAVRKIYDRVKYEEKQCPKVTLQVTKEGLKITEGKRSQDDRFYPVKDMSYCTLNRYEASIFAFNHHISKTPQKVECHAVMCSSEDKAKAIALALYSVYRETHFEELRKERKSASTRRNSKGEIREGNQGSEDSEADQKYESKSFNNSIARECDAGVVEGREENELDNIVKDMLETVEREKASLENSR